MEFLARPKEEVEAETEVQPGASPRQLTPPDQQQNTNILTQQNSTEIPQLGLAQTLYSDPEDETSPRTSNLMYQFSQVQLFANSAVGDDDDDVDYPLPRREDLITPPDKEKVEALLTEDHHNNSNEQIQMDAIDFDIWDEKFIPPPPSSSLTVPTLVGSFYGQIDNTLEIPRTNLFETLPDYKENFTLESRPVELVVSKIPEDLVRARHREIEAAEAKALNDLTSLAKNRERDLLWREHQARTRVTAMETMSRERLQNEIEKIYETKKDKEELLARQFRRAKEDMESFLSKQEAHLQEVHGEVVPDQVGSPFPALPRRVSLTYSILLLESWSKIPCRMGKVSSAY
jgi:hypothetical protein